MVGFHGDAVLGSSHRGGQETISLFFASLTTRAPSSTDARSRLRRSAPRPETERSEVGMTKYRFLVVEFERELEPDEMQQIRVALRKFVAGDEIAELPDLPVIGAMAAGVES